MGEPKIFIYILFCLVLFHTQQFSELTPGSNLDAEDQSSQGQLYVLYSYPNTVAPDPLFILYH